MVSIVDIFNFWIKDLISSDAVYIKFISDISTIWLITWNKKNTIISWP